MRLNKEYILDEYVYIGYSHILIKLKDVDSGKTERLIVESVKFLNTPTRNKLKDIGIGVLDDFTAENMYFGPMVYRHKLIWGEGRRGFITFRLLFDSCDKYKLFYDDCLLSFKVTFSNLIRLTEYGLNSNSRNPLWSTYMDRSVDDGYLETSANYYIMRDSEGNVLEKIPKYENRIDLDFWNNILKILFGGRAVLKENNFKLGGVL